MKLGLDEFKTITGSFVHKRFIIEVDWRYVNLHIFDH